MKKPLGALFLFVILVALPAATWMFMKSGLQYRKQAMAELAEKIPFDQTKIFVSGEDKLEGHTTVVDFADNPTFSDSLFNQFKKTEGFQLVTAQLPSSKVIFSNSVHQISNTVVDDLKRSYPGKSFILIDNESYVRYIYDDSKDDLQKLVKHIATLLPFIPKRESEKKEE